jgi:hypothetical protein
MRYRVIRGFQDVDGWKAPGDTVEAEGWRETRLRSMRLIGPVEESTVAAPERAVRAEPETATEIPRETAENPRRRRKE